MKEEKKFIRNSRERLIQLNYNKENVKMENG